ncbi:hypothetical protein U879_20895 [Defluviimonas sp. 20V17]|nr:hypothetical protein U879_20895 [Defluviimonas sp. 20V17]
MFLDDFGFDLASSFGHGFCVAEIDIGGREMPRLP